MVPDQTTLIPEIADDIYRDRIQRARAVPQVEKLLDGMLLYDRALQWMLMGLRAEHPSADEVTIRRLASERLALLRRRDEAGIYQQAGLIDDE